MAGSSEEQPIAQVVDMLDVGAVRHLLTVAAGQHPSVAKAVRLAAASPADRVTVLRALVDDSLRTRRFLGYRESVEWADEADVAVRALSVEADINPSRELLALVERAISHVVKVIFKADDSSGSIGGLVSDLLEVHERLCDSGVADPDALVRWMVKFGFDDQDFFAIDPVRYADALGDRGVELFRKAVEKRPHRREDEFAVAFATQRLAILDGNVDRVIELLGGDLTSPHQYINVATAMAELQRPDHGVAGGPAVRDPGRSAGRKRADSGAARPSARAPRSDGERVYLRIASSCCDREQRVAGGSRIGKISSRCSRSRCTHRRTPG